MARVSLYLPPGLRRAAAAGEHNFLKQLQGVLQEAGHEVRLRPEPGGRLVRAVAGLGDPLALVHMLPPVGRCGLTFRRVYHYPFWQIERRAERWERDVARARFEGVPDRAEAGRFHAFWARRLFGEAPGRARREGVIYVPLQGRLMERRSFQSIAPVEMVREVIANAGGREVWLGLHPNETYSPRERAALAALEGPRVRVKEGGMAEALEVCDMVVTQNSSVAFNGIFFGKPAVICARIDFHHVALDAGALGIGPAMARAAEHDPDYAGYAWWFWQERALNAGRPEIGARLAARLRALGWPV